MTKCNAEMKEVQEVFNKLARENTIALYFDQMADSL